MSYAVIKIYAFECDGPGCNETYEFMPRPDKLSTLRNAHQELCEAGWDRDSGQHFCPAHKGIALGRRGKRALDRAAREVMPDDSVVESNRDSARQPCRRGPRRGSSAGHRNASC